MDSSSESITHQPASKVGRTAAVAIGATALVAIGAAVQSHVQPQANTSGFLGAVDIRSVNQFTKCLTDASCANVNGANWAAQMAPVERIVSPTPTDGTYSAAEVALNRWLTTVDASLQQKARFSLFSLPHLGSGDFKTAFEDTCKTGTTAGADCVAFTAGEKTKVLSMLESSTALPNPFLTGADTGNQQKMEYLHTWMQHAPKSMAAIGKLVIDPASSGQAKSGLQRFKSAYFKGVAQITATGDCYTRYGVGAISALNAAIVSSTATTKVSTDLPDKTAAGTDTTNTLAAKIVATVTSLTVKNDWVAANVIKIGDELMLVTNVAAKVLTVKRGLCGTVAATHAANAKIYKAATKQIDVSEMRTAYAAANADDRQSANSQMALQAAAVPALQ